MTDVYLASSEDAYKGACEALDALNFSVTGKRVFIKPNLTGGLESRYGLTIDTGIVRAVLERLHECPLITIGESCGDTARAFKELGYEDLAREFDNIVLEDIREAEIVWKDIPKPYHTKEMPFHASLFEHDYVINIAKMKTHSLAGVTLCMKNIFGCVPTRKQKLMYHPFIRKAILDMNQIVKSDFCIVDGIWGNEFDEIQSTPKHSGAIIAGENILAVDMIAAEVMGINLSAIDTYQRAFELWGDPDINMLGANFDEVKRFYRQGALFSTRIRYIKETAASLVYRALNRH
ncbi:MAG: DUF362 domain-containing protein [Nitrospira sp.]|nr:DUF362 domain-containing protein [bacterium]MBL7047977.1 DUF362 domain-containing protein [Nitrospira sp.]